MEAAKALIEQREQVQNDLVKKTPPSPAGPIDPSEAATLPEPPAIQLPRFLQVLRFNQRQIELMFKARRELGEVFRMRGMVAGRPTITSHPDHVRSLFKAKPEQAPSLTRESPLRPVVGPNSVLTAVGERHMRQRKLLLPSFHGEAIQRYVQMISDAAEREISSWPVGTPVALAPRMQAITLDVIMGGIFGIEGKPARGTVEGRLRYATRSLVQASTWPLAQVAELMNIGRDEPRGFTKIGLSMLDRATHAVIEDRRRAKDLDERKDILSMLLLARNEQGESLSDDEVRDELTTLVLAGHETTGTALAWALECLLQRPAIVRRIREEMAEVAGPGEAPRGREPLAKLEYLDAAIKEVLRFRPIMAFGGTRLLQAPWRLGEWEIPAGAAVANALSMVHRRPDLYPEPHEFRPERFLGKRPDPYEWTPFGGGVRRCLGMAFALYEMKIVLAHLLSTIDLELADSQPVRAVTRGFFIAPEKGLPIRIRPGAAHRVEARAQARPS